MCCLTKTWPCLLAESSILQNTFSAITNPEGRAWVEAELLHNEGNSFSPECRPHAVLLAIALKVFRIIRWQRELVFVPLRNDKRSSFLTKILS